MIPCHWLRADSNHFHIIRHGVHHASPNAIRERIVARALRECCKEIVTTLDKIRKGASWSQRLL
jgi:hypothetical protein